MSDHRASQGRAAPSADRTKLLPKVERDQGRFIHPVPATKFVTSNSYKLFMVPSCDIVTVQT